MDRSILLAFAVAVGPGCTRTYWARPGDLERAAQRAREARQEVHIPAIDGAGEATFLSADAIESVGETDPDGLQEVFASDPRSGEVALGWTAIALGTVTLVSTFAKDGLFADAKGAGIGVSVFFFGGGFVLAWLGYGSDGPERDGPTDDMPRSVRGDLR